MCGAGAERGRGESAGTWQDAGLGGERREAGPGRAAEEHQEGRRVR